MRAPSATTSPRGPRRRPRWPPCLTAHGRVDIACANAGIGCNVPLLELDSATWERVLAVNTTGVLTTLQVFGARMVEQRSGSLVVTASISSLRGAHSMGAYCASKFAVQGLVESLAKEVGEFGVRVNSVNPGPVEGGLARAMIRETAETQGRSEQESYDELTAPIALGRLVEPEEVADAVVFLASPLAGSSPGSGSSSTAECSRSRAARQITLPGIADVSIVC